MRLFHLTTIGVALVLATGCGPIDDQPEWHAGKGDGPAPVSPAKIETAVALWESGETGVLRGVGGVQLHYKAFLAEEELGVVVIVTGRTESHAKYAELIHDLHGQGLSLYIYDHRGQGFSERLLDDPRKGYVDDFSDYVNDLRAFVLQVIRPRHPASPLLALGHSMGGAVLAQHEIYYPGSFAGVALTSPMFEIAFPDMRALINERFPGWQEWVPDSFTDEDIADWYAWYMDNDAVDSAASDEEETFETNQLTSSRARYAMIAELLERQRAAGVRPLGAPADTPAGIEVGAATYGWIGEAIDGGQAIRERARYLRTPTLLLSAGADEVVVSSTQATVCSAAPSCELHSFADAKHELLMERDEIRSPALRRIIDFFHSKLGRR